MQQGNQPIAEVPENTQQQQPAAVYGDMSLATDGGNAPVAEQAPEEDPED